MKVKTKLPFSTVSEGRVISPRAGSILTVSDEAGETMISDGVAEEYKLVEPTGKKIITANGTDIDVASYATVDVSVTAEQ